MIERRKSKPAGRKLSLTNGTDRQARQVLDRDEMLNVECRTLKF